MQVLLKKLWLPDEQGVEIWGGGEEARAGVYWRGTMAAKYVSLFIISSSKGPKDQDQSERRASRCGYRGDVDTATRSLKHVPVTCHPLQY